MTISLVDTTLRDGNQSLWGATGLNTAQMLQIAPVMERVGYEAIDFTTSTHMGVAVRFKQENPWERISLMREAMPETPLSFLTTGMRFISWESASAELMELAFRCLVRRGIRRFSVMDPMNAVPAMLAMADLARKAGGESIVAALTFTLSPLHDDAHFAAAAAALAGSGRFDRLYLKDPGGLVTPDRAASLFPALRRAIGALPLEFHSHSTIGLAQFAYPVAVQNGASCLHTAAAAAANGTSQPAGSSVVRNLRDLGLNVAVDTEALAEVDAYFDALVMAEDLPRGVPQDFDSSYFRHQMPGGMMGTLKRQLSETKRLHLLPRVLEEVEQVRADLGYPIMVTPFSQVVGTQALLNVISGTRYETIPDEVIRYALGRFGRPAMALDGALEDRIRSLPRAAALEAEPVMGSLDELRVKFGKGLSDEEFLLRATMPAEHVDAMLAAGPATRGYDPASRPLMELIRALAARKDLEHIRITRPDFDLSLSCGAS